jgi:TetR/AcrR family transcriptional regulator, acrAB operon repressor
MRRTKEEAAITHDRLLKAALEVFSRKGYASTTLEDVAKETGVTRGAIYWHFGSKAELYGALLDKYSSRSGEITQAAVAEGGSLKDILRRVFTRLLEAVETDPALRSVMEISLFKTEWTPDLSDYRKQQQENSRSLVAGIAETMRQGAAYGDLRLDIDPLEMARAFLAFSNGAIYLWLQDPVLFSLKASAEALVEIYMKGISAPGA